MEENRKSEIHADDKDGKCFEDVRSATKAVEEYYRLDYGQSILIPANVINQFLRAMEAVQETNFIIVPSIKSMRRMIYSNIDNNGYLYLIVKVANDNMWKITDVIYNTRKIEN